MGPEVRGGARAGTGELHTMSNKPSALAAGSGAASEETIPASCSVCSWRGTAAIAFAADWLVQQQIGYQQQRNQRLQQGWQPWTQLGRSGFSKGRRKRLIDRMQLIEQLQMRHNIPVRLFNQLPVLVPNGVYLDQPCSAKATR